MDSEISIPGYQVVRLDRNHNGGCVLMYVSVDLHFSVLFNPDELELLTIVVSHESGKACISFFTDRRVLHLIFLTLFVFI